MRRLIVLSFALSGLCALPAPVPSVQATAGDCYYVQAHLPAGGDPYADVCPPDAVVHVGRG